MAAILECRQLVKKYGSVQALNGIDLELPEGKIIGLLGPNGSGKTTLIKLASGLLQPTSGEILIDGMKPGVETKRIVAYLPERNYLEDRMTVEQMLKFMQDFYADFNMDKAREMLTHLDIDPKTKFKALSKGLDTIIKNYNKDATVILSTHLIADIEPVLDEFVFIRKGDMIRHSTVASVVEQGETVDSLFREVFRC